jgi:hypothetical protein
MLGSFPPELLVVFTATSLLRSEEPTLSCNQLSTFDRSMSGLPLVSISALAIWRHVTRVALALLPMIKG